MFFVLSGGGTAGHVTPAIAIAEALKKKYPDAKILFIGRDGGKENSLIKKSGFDIKTITIFGLKRKITVDNLRAISVVSKACKEVKNIIYGADLVIGTGGYVCFPVLKSAKKLGIPTLLHESNSTLGLTSKLLARNCDALCLGYDKVTKYKNAIFVGNPLRESFKPLPKAIAKNMLGIPENAFFIVSVGGSGGAQKINEAAIELMKSFTSKNENVYHLHSCGKGYYEAISKQNPELCAKRRYRITPFIENMATVLSAADTVITRCGAMTLAEIAYCRAAPILIPSPNVTGNHQLKNAKAFASRTGAFIIEERELSAKALEDRVKSYYENPSMRHIIGKKSALLCNSDPKNRILRIIDEIICKKEGV